MGVGGVVGLVAGILGVNALLWVLLFRWLRGKTEEVANELRALVARSGEELVMGPATGLYRGSTARFGRVKGTSVLALTDRRLLCRKVTGGLVEVPLAEVAGVREDKWFVRAYAGGRQHLILQLGDGVEVGFQVQDHPRWMEAVRQRLGGRAASPT